jgi:hypothetical protein
MRLMQSFVVIRAGIARHVVRAETSLSVRSGDPGRVMARAVWR